LLSGQAYKAESGDDKGKLIQKADAPEFGFERFLGLIAGNTQLDREAGKQAKADETSGKEDASVLLHMGCHANHRQQNAQYLKPLTETGMLCAHGFTRAS
jgi:hypothetical protein